jgi:hypothetical protein
MIITAAEILDTLPISKEFPPQYFKNSIIQKQELLLANQFLGETFYSELLESKTGTGTFDNLDTQNLYDTYLKTLISEAILLSVCIQLTLRFEAVGINQMNADHSQIINDKLISVYKDQLNEAVASSKLLVTSFLLRTANTLIFPNFLGGGNIEQNTEKTDPKTFAGFLLDYEY